MLNSFQKWIGGYFTETEGVKTAPSFVGGFESILSSLKESLSEIISDDSLVKAHSAYRALLGIPQFKHLLPYQDYLSNEELFLLEGNGFDDTGRGVVTHGFVLELHSPQTGSDLNMERVLQSVFLQAPTGTSISVTLYATPHIKDRMIGRANSVFSDSDLGMQKEAWEVRNTNIYRTAIRNRIDFYNKGAFKSPVGGVRGYLFKDFRVIISVVLPTSIQSPNSLEEALSYRDSLESTLSSAHLPVFRWDPNILLNWVSDMLDHNRLLNEKHSRVKKTYEPNLPYLKDNFSRTGGMASISPNQINHDVSDSCFVSMSVVDYPKDSWFMANMGNMIGDFFQGALSYPCPYMITMNAVCGDRSGFKSKASMMSARKTQQMGSQAAKFIPSISEEAAEWKYAVRALDDGATMVNMGVKISLFSPRSEVKKNIAEVTSVWTNKGFTVYPDTYLAPLGFKAVIPMGLTKTVADDLLSMGHIGPKFSSNAVALSPFIAEWKGTKNNTITLFGRRGQIMGFDLYDNDAGNYNFAVIAGSGSGKSFFLNEIAFSYLSKGGKVWIIDVGRSYLKLCNVLGGDFVEFSESSDICINPFSFIQDINEEMEVLKPLLSQMMTGDDNRLTGVQLAELERAVKSTWDKYGRQSTITLVRDELASMCDESQQICAVGEMAKMLYPWTKSGIYGRYFEGEANLNFTNPFTVLELEELKSKKALQTVVLMILMYRITNDMYVNRDGSKKIVIIDEAWSLMSGGDTAEFIETGYRRARKYGGAFGTATQSVDDYYKNEGALAALNNADWVFMLRQKKESIQRFEKDGKISMDPWKKRTLFDLTTKHGVFSEVFVNYPGGEGVGRLFVDPFTSLLYSSKDDDFQSIKAKEAQGLSTAEAITAVLKDRGISVV